MTTYLVFAIVYYNAFEGLPLKGNVDTDKKPIQFWYPVLWRHKTPFHFYIIQEIFLREFKHVLNGLEPKRITWEVEEFLKGKGICIKEKNHTYIWLYGCQERPLMLLIFVYDRYFVAGVCR
jgi:hypothetical protein